MSSDTIGTLERYLENGDLPKLPGFQIRTPNVKPQAKPQQLRYINGIPGLYPEVRGARTRARSRAPRSPRGGGAAERRADAPRRNRTAPHQAARLYARPKSAPVARKPVPPPSRGKPAASHLQPNLNAANVEKPAWLAYDRQVLRYYGYVEETVSERRDEVLRIRKLVILYYLADDSIYIAEPKEANSGLPQGPFLKRHKVKRENGDLVSYLNLVVGGGVTLYGRSIYITGCDDFTRAFLTDKGYSVRPNAEAPEGDIKKVIAGPRRVDKPMKESSRSRKFIDFDRVVLRFNGIWDDSKKNEFGKKHRFVIHFYLADDTIEIVENHERNSGYAEFSTNVNHNFLRRCRLPKQLPQIGMRPMSADSRSSSPYVCYTADDLAIGAAISVYTREIVIYDCDDFTREYCIKHMGRSAAAMAPVDVQDKASMPKKAPPPPYRPGISMIGGEKDSLQSCIHLVPKPPTRDMISFMEKDGKVMRFLAAFSKASATGPGSGAFDYQRRFLVNFFLVDDTLSVFEPPVRNSGIVGGKFFERGECKNAATGDIYGQEDLYVGAVIKVSNREFELLQADDYTLNYMEQYSSTFPQSDAELVLAKVRAHARDAGIDRDGLLTAVGEYESSSEKAGGGGDGLHFGVAMLHRCVNAAGCRITKQEAVTVFRSLGKDRCSVDDVVRLMTQ